ncbi:MAG: glycerol kinase, partial [Pseudomonadales bacterium]
TVVRASTTETTALGAAWLAGLQAGVFASLEEVAGHWAQDAKFNAKMPAPRREELYAGWQAAVARVRTGV